ncbi:DNA-binding CsgD family transcriptional regulator [Bradyrhizobium sp. USDA 3686]|uniref:helix-turn-helix transcriptional regulator n=1 Tax=Bradyrhizobium TaxID=374 RepID=UPI0019587A5E|nr:helix-turn-helix transcriptional regulator [Bradyrhizobium canariense]MBM7485835.1 DNA-binding CsgD family transcriptional regulator [Bradyrhizobium canariense]UFW73113.1 helix-turn-helix transcriptional regulator [Bradyrhizobium canariense]
MQQASVEKFSDLIGSVYDCVIAPEGWTEVLDQICAQFGFATGALSVASLTNMKAVVNAVSGSDLAQMAQNGVGYGPDIIELWGGAERIRQYPLGEPVVARHGRIAVQSAASTATLQSAVAQAAKDEATLGQKGIGIPIPRQSGEPLVVHVLPLRRSHTRSGLIQSAAAAVFVTSASGPPRLPHDALNQLYDLTPAEIRIFELICEGHTRDAISALLGVSVSTVKSHLIHVFEKTGCRRQVDLVRLAKSLTFPV